MRKLSYPLAVDVCHNSGRVFGSDSWVTEDFNHCFCFALAKIFKDFHQGGVLPLLGAAERGLPRWLERRRARHGPPCVDSRVYLLSPTYLRECLVSSSVADKCTYSRKEPSTICIHCEDFPSWYFKRATLVLILTVFFFFSRQKVSSSYVCHAGKFIFFGAPCFSIHYCVELHDVVELGGVEDIFIETSSIPVLTSPELAFFVLKFSGVLWSVVCQFMYLVLHGALLERDMVVPQKKRSIYSSLLCH